MQHDVKVLLVEDDEDDAILTREYLGQIVGHNFFLTWVSNANSANEALEKEDFDVVLVDHILGATLGTDFIKQMRLDNNLTPAILLTGRADKAIDIDASKAGAKDYLVKSELTPAMLERSIRYAIIQYRTVRALNEQEKKYRLLFERSVDCIFLANVRFEMIDVNQSFSQFFGFTSEEKVSLQTLFADIEAYEICKRTLQKNEQIKDYEVTFVAKDGQTKICLLNCVFVPDQDSEFCCYQGIIRDLTLRKRAERDLRIAERLSMSGELARTIAHEIRNPLTNLNLALENLKTEIQPANEMVDLYGQIITRNALRIENLLSDLLKSSKPKNLQLAKTDVNTLVQQTIGLAQDRINLKNIKLSTDLASELPSLQIDADKVQMALLNVIINAIEALDKEEKTLAVATYHIKNELTISVTDNGVGIAAEEIQKMFDPFYTAKAGGTGLGLTTTLNILSSHNARVQVESTVGAGTTFFIKFSVPEIDMS